MRPALATLPAIEPLTLARVDAVPDTHPEHATVRPFPVYGFAIRHPDGVIVVDTGIGRGSALIDGLYRHRSWSLVERLHRAGVDERDVRLVVNSHLHFDHCGQNGALSCPIVVQRDEVAAAAVPYYTVPEWAAVPAARSMVVDGDADVAHGVSVWLTPGHTPGHQVVVVRSREGTSVVAAQCVFRRPAWDGAPEEANLHDPSWAAAASDSLRRLRALAPVRVHLSHDAPFSPGAEPRAVA